MRSFISKNILPLVLGLSDGIITVLTFTAGSLLAADTTPITIALALRVATAALISGVFVYFVSQYAELRHQLIHTERQLNLTKRGHLAMTHLGRQVFLES